MRKVEFRSHPRRAHIRTWSVRRAGRRVRSPPGIPAGFSAYGDGRHRNRCEAPSCRRRREPFSLSRVTRSTTRRTHQRAPHQRPDPRPRGPACRPQRRAGRHRPHRGRPAAGPGADLDLVEVAPIARPPVCKLMDYGKFKYESAMKAREARKNQANTVIKEMKLRPKIDPHDYETKKGHVVRFLKAGRQGQGHDHVPRPRAVPSGARLPAAAAAGRGHRELGFVECTPKQDGRNMIMVLGPHQKKAEAKAEERRRASSPRPAVFAHRGVRSRRGAAEAGGDGDGRRARPTSTPTRRRTLRSRRRPTPAATRLRQTDVTNPERTAPGGTAGRTPPYDREPGGREGQRRGDHGAMPKMKTHSGAKKRFRVTGTGKIMREQATTPLLEHKSVAATRALSTGRRAWPRPTPRRSRGCSAS